MVPFGCSPPTGLESLKVGWLVLLWYLLPCMICGRRPPALSTLLYHVHWNILDCYLLLSRRVLKPLKPPQVAPAATFSRKGFGEHHQ
jgi:hypothetical protein